MGRFINWFIFVILKSMKASSTTSTYYFDLTIIFLGHNNEGKPAKTMYLSCSVWGNIAKLTFWVAAILDYKMTKSDNQSILFPTYKNVVIATKIDFLYCLASEILSKQLLDGRHFAIQDGGPKRFRSNGNGFWFWFLVKWILVKCFLVSERSELSKNVRIYMYNSPKNVNEST